MSHLLEVKDFHYYYGRIHAVKGIDFFVDRGEVVTLIGANGAGKSTTVNAIAGLLNSNGIKGDIIFDEDNIAKKSGHEICNKGIMTVIEGRRVFPQLTVYENLLMGAYSTDIKDLDKIFDEIYNYFPILKERRKQKAGSLSGGEQQMLVIARALMKRPKMILMDEPSLGLAPIIVSEIFKIIKKINKEKNITILLVEQNSRKALSISDRGYVLQNGVIKLEGTGSQLLETEEVKKYYLGK